MILFIIILIIVVVAVYVFLQQPIFGRKPAGARLQRVLNSPNFREGQFQNEHHTPSLTGDASYLRVMKEFFFSPKIRRTPSKIFPTKKTNLLQLSPEQNVLVWFGHSSYFLQVERKKILVDPVFSGHASPVSFTTRSFPGTDIYSTDDLPEIDLLILTHDHYDHLDYKTIVQLKPKVRKIITSLGVAAHLERWGYDHNTIIETDWNETLELKNGFRIISTPARHFSGRIFKRNGSLWSSFVLQTPARKIFIGGDSGYDDHFARIGQQHGPFELAILENGQYNQYWKFIHMMPEETVQAAFDLRARKLLPVHWGKFSLSLHPWDEPIIRIVLEAEKRNLPLLHPMIGEAVFLDQPGVSVKWWEGIE
ncbi:MAG: MBL fold metallo-hydrolase [Flavisolibacter sp.]